MFYDPLRMQYRKGIPRSLRHYLCFLRIQDLFYRYRGTPNMIELKEWITFHKTWNIMSIHFGNLKKAAVKHHGIEFGQV